jgi:hypothetical protein
MQRVCDGWQTRFQLVNPKRSFGDPAADGRIILSHALVTIGGVQIGE